MSEEIAKILNAIDKTAKPVSSILAILLNHRIGWLARIPRELKGAIEAIDEVIEDEE